TVDNVDTIIGQISLALIMTGQEGNYGIKEGADALMPLLPEEKSDENIGINSSL
ncbi:MAG: copper transporter, partial [Clostridia bacterium]|nr:copper transporter [Clostridia bacterium]